MQRRFELLESYGAGTQHDEAVKFKLAGVYVFVSQRRQRQNVMGVLLYPIEDVLVGVINHKIHAKVHL